MIKTIRKRKDPIIRNLLKDSYSVSHGNSWVSATEGTNNIFCSVLSHYINNVGLLSFVEETHTSVKFESKYNNFHK